jgi:hypothetical protein
MKLLTLAALTVVGALSGAAGPAGQAAISAPGVDTAATAASTSTDTCFKRRDVHNHTVGGPKTLYLDVYGSGVYRVEMSNSCLASATSYDPLIFNNQTGSQSVCKPMDLDITVSAAGPSKCIVSSISKLSPAEVAALPKKMRP